MEILLLAVIYISFVSLGLPDSLLGAAWPTIHTEMNILLTLKIPHTIRIGMRINPVIGIPIAPGIVETVGIPVAEIGVAIGKIFIA